MDRQAVRYSTRRATVLDFDIDYLYQTIKWSPLLLAEDNC